MRTVEEFVETQSRSLLRSAWLLTGNWASAEDLVQTALVDSWRHWDSIRSDAPEVYVRRVLVTTYLRWQRRRWTGERPVADVPERYEPDRLAISDLRSSIRDALSALPPKQRAVVMLRYFSDLTEADTAAVLGCSVGNVKSQASRALQKLRNAPELHALLEDVTL